MKVLYLTKYSRNAGSSRLRSYQYFPWLNSSGIEVEVSPLFSEDYLKQLYQSKSTKIEGIKGYLKRFLKLVSVKKYDRIVIEKELFPYLPAVFEKMLHQMGVKYIVDYDDAVFHNYDRHSSKWVRKILGSKIAEVMKWSDIVIAGNRYLADYAKNSGAQQISVIPTVIDLNRYPVKNHRESEKFVVGWIGTKSTFEKHLLPCLGWMKELVTDHPDIVFHIVGPEPVAGLSESFHFIPWSEETEVVEIMKMDVGVMPLQNSEWEKGKCAYKLIQYAACGIPGIASDVGMNKDVTQPDVTGFLADSPQQWRSFILQLKSDRSLIEQLGTNARDLVEEKYCIQATAQDWIKILRK